MKKNTPFSIRARTLLLASLIAAGGLAGCGKTNFTDIEHIARAKDFQGKGDLTASVIELKGALKKNPGNAEARWLLRQIYVDLENGAAAEKELERAIKDSGKRMLLNIRGGNSAMSIVIQ